MKQKIIYIFLMFVLVCSNNVIGGSVPCLDGAGPLLIGQEYCSEESNSFFNFLAPEHYELEYASVFTHYFNVEQNDENPLTLYIDFGFDLNNANPIKKADNYIMV